MKRLIIFKSLLMFSIACFSQSYQPFDFENGMWYCRYVSKGGWFGADFERTKYVTDSVKFYCNGDTTINDFVYKKLYYSGFSSVLGLPEKPISGYYSAIRNDTINKKILYAPAGYDAANTGSGFILYDFNLAVGDSIGYNYSTSKKDIVTSIDTVVYCNRAHRRFNTESGWNTLIEGIGSVNALFPLVSPTDYGILLCYQEYGNNDCVDCKIFTPISSVVSNELNIYPNPTTGELNIVPNDNIQSIEIFDIHGKMVDKIVSDFDNIKLNQNGVFILRINRNNQLYIQKIVKCQD